MWVAEHQVQTRCDCGSLGPTSAGAAGPGGDRELGRPVDARPRQYISPHSLPFAARNTLRKASGAHQAGASALLAVSGTFTLGGFRPSRVLGGTASVGLRFGGLLLAAATVSGVALRLANHLKATPLLGR